MSISLSEFISQFEQENQAAFLIIKQTVEEIESKCKRNRKSSIEVGIDEKNSCDNYAKTQSGSSIDRFACGSKTTAESSNCLEPYSASHSIGKTICCNLANHFCMALLKASIDNALETKNTLPVPTRSLAVISESESNAPTPMQRERISSATSDSGNTREFKKEYDTVRSVKASPMRMPFFALNIKTLKIRGRSINSIISRHPLPIESNVSIVEVDSKEGTKEHSPILKPLFTHSTKSDNRVIEQLSDLDSPVIALPLSDDGEKKMKSPLRLVRSQKPNAKLGNRFFSFLLTDSF